MSTDGDAESEAFVELLLQEVRSSADLDCPSVQMLLEMARSGDYDTVADALSYLVEAGVPDKAAACLRYIMAAKPAPSQPQPQHPDGGSEAAESPGQPEATPAPTPATIAGSIAAVAAPKAVTPDYSTAGKVLNRLIELGHLSEAQDLVKFLLVARETDQGRGKMLDCYDVSMVLGSMVPEDGSESAGRLLFALYSSDTGEDSAASQTLVPFILGTLLDHRRADWAVELGKQLMYTTLEEIEAGAGEYDYSVLGWCLAQMVWYGRADWAARLCVELERQQLEWYSPRDMFNSVAGWGDSSYSATIVNFMQEAKAKDREREEKERREKAAATAAAAAKATDQKEGPPGGGGSKV